MREQRLRTSEITFYGVCRNCDKRLDLTNYLTAEQKIAFIEKAGYEYDENGKAICKYVYEMQTCPSCCKAFQ